MMSDNPFLELGFADLRDALAEVEQDLQTLQAEYADAKRQFEQATVGEVAEVKRLKAAITAAEGIYRTRVQEFQAETRAVREKIMHLQTQSKQLRAALKPKATDNVQPKQLGSGMYRPPSMSFGGVSMARVRQVIIKDEAEAANILAGITVEKEGQRIALVTVEVVYTFYKPGIRAWLLEDETRCVPGVLELTAKDDPASYRMTVQRDQPSGDDLATEAES
jgi:hypothetical protein